MGDEFYSVLKLVTGEEIFSLVMVDENDGDSLVILQNPVIMKMIENSTGYYIKIHPWMSIPDDDFYIIKSDKIITMTEIKDKKMIFLYNRYLNENNEDNNIMGLDQMKDGNVKLSHKMGYISSVDDARKKLEDIFKSNEA